MNQLHARRAAFARPATGFVSQPEPRSIGRLSRGRQLAAGNLQFAGHMIAAPGAMLWDVPAPSLAYEEERQGFAWLDDLAAFGDAAARDCAQAWTAGWIERYGRGRGPGWTPDLTGRRLIRWINHALFLLNGQSRAFSEAYYRALARQTVFLSRRWHAASPGLPRFEALTGLIYAGLSLIGMERLVDPAIAALSRECRSQIDAGGAIPTRNPEELLEVFTLLTWAAAALSEAGRHADPAHVAAIERIAPTLRALRHADGGLARFHGGGRGIEGRLDAALASSGVRSLPRPGERAMGFARLSHGRTTVIMDAAAPPSGAASANAHASTLAFELTSGRRPLIVNCGSGAPFGEDWRAAGRATASHSTLSIDGYSSSRLGGRTLIGGIEREYLEDIPRDVRFHASEDAGGSTVVGGHDGYASTHGLTHARALELSSSGRALAGEDTLGCVTSEDRKRFERAMDRVRLAGIPFRIRFHLHPDVDAEINMNGAAVSMELRSGEIWVLRHDGTARLSLEPSVYLEKGRLMPRPTLQVVLSARALEPATRIRWTLAKALDTPDAVRDLARDDDEDLDLTS